jgi:GNAT superfamily N-acetyltransferase
MPLTVAIHRNAGESRERILAFLSLIQTTFAPMRGVIDPPSSAERLDEAGLAAKVAAETVYIARVDQVLVGCVFLAPRDDHLYLGKLAVAPAFQGRGIGRALIEAAIGEARRLGVAAIELQTRVELVQNHAVFERLGFRHLGSTAHPGYTRPTSRTYRLTI